MGQVSTPARCAATFVVLFAVTTVIPWESARVAYGKTFAAVAHFLVHRMWGSGPIAGTDAIVQVTYAPPASDPRRDVSIQVANRRKLHSLSDVAVARVSARHIGYVPAGTFVSLMIASPLAWKRRFLAMCWGLLVVHLFVAIRMIVLLLSLFGSEGSHQLIQPGRFAAAALQLLATMLTESPSVTYIVPVFVWFAALAWHARGAQAAADTKTGTRPPAGRKRG